MESVEIIHMDIVMIGAAASATIYFVPFLFSLAARSFFKMVG